MPQIQDPSDRIGAPPLLGSGDIPSRRVRLDPAERGAYLDETLRVLDDLLAGRPTPEQALEVHRILRARAVAMRSDRSAEATGEYARFLQRLARRFAPGCGQRENTAFALAAPAYAALVEALSWARPRLDYAPAIGQLLELMTQLFAARQPLWKLVYRHLRSIPGSVDAKQTLKRVCSADIREWYDAGVQNLFSLQSDLSGRIDGLSRNLAGVDQEIGDKRQALATLRATNRAGNVILLEEKLRERELDVLMARREELLAEHEGRTGTLALIESDIQEFESLLREARRAYYLRLA